MTIGVTGRQYTLGEEIANAVTHGLGVALSIAALAVLEVVAVRFGSPQQIAIATVYGTTLVLLYLASTLYHSLSSTRACKVFKVIDHASIYLLIAGTYTPFTLLALKGVWGWTMFGVVWGLALIGVALEGFWVYRPKWVSSVVYVGMGWIAVLAIKPLIAALPPAGLWLLIGGGLAYTLGVAFYVLKRVRYMHAVWHLFVLAGSALHFFAVVLYVMPAKG